MMKHAITLILAALFSGSIGAAAQEEHHDHPAPERLGTVVFPTSCAPGTNTGFTRGVALMHSFAYSAAHHAFMEVAEKDPNCAMAYWGEALSHYHALWEPQVDSEDEMREAESEATRAGALPASPREKQYIEAAQIYYRDWQHATPAIRAQRFADAMAALAKANPKDEEAQVFYALALVATASPTDPTHKNQKMAAAILEPRWKQQPQHPGIPHYMIHAYDSTELAPRGLPAARAYAKIAPSAPHALHMPSHIFTRMGFWTDSVSSNIAAQTAAKEQKDIGEELHAADYLTYAYLQLGRDTDARAVAAVYAAMPSLQASQFKIGYAANAMPVRLAVERHDWDRAVTLTPLPGSPPHVAAIVYWARALGHTRGKNPSSPDADIKALEECREKLRALGNDYWAMQVDGIVKSARAWKMKMDGDLAGAVTMLRAAADQEDGLEKLPVTPGPVVPAREQLAELLLEVHRPADALTEFKADLVLAPGRRDALQGAAMAAQETGDSRAEGQYRALLQSQSAGR